MQYFFSFVPVALKINGEFKGIIHTEPVAVNVKQTDFIEFICTQNSFLPICFTLKNKPDCVRALYSRYGDFIYPLSFTPYPVYQKHFEYDTHDLRISVVSKGICKVYFYTVNTQQSYILPQKPQSCQVILSENGYIGLLLQLNKPYCIVFNISTGQLVFNCHADKIVCDGKKITTENFIPTLCKHKKITTFYRGEKTEMLTRENPPLNELQLKYAFLECANLNDDLSQFLSDDLNQNSIKNFIGDFDCILPPLSEKYDFCLAGEKLKFVKIELLNDKICDIIVD